MYGRKLSAESRAKISRSMAARKTKEGEAEKEEPVKKAGISERTWRKLRRKAAESRFFVGEQGEYQELLDRVAGGLLPPRAVEKAVAISERVGREVEVKEVCAACGGRGMVGCEGCVGAFGVGSRKCERCFGAGKVFCDVCDGVGRGTIGD